MILLDGKKASQKVKKEITKQVTLLKNKNKRVPHLVAVIVGNDGASLTYVSAKVKACKQVGFDSTLMSLPKNTTQEELLSVIQKLNNDKRVDGFIVQLPLPKHINEKVITLAINPKKDVDGFHPENLGKMILGLDGFLPATPYGILELLEQYDIETQGKNTIVVGRSHIVGIPISVLMARKHKIGNSTVTLAHSRTKNLSKVTLSADIIILALGIPQFLTQDMVKEGVVIIDVGITRVEDKNKKSGFKLLGDANFEQLKTKASYMTPVPGGVGPMTIAMLMKNTLKAYQI